VERSRERENEILTFARDELERRRRAPVFVDGARVRAGLAAENQQGMIHLIDPRMGFSVRSIRLWVNLFGFDEGHMGWKTLGHRHLIDAVIHILRGRGYSILDGVRYDWEAGDFLCVPTFAWHRHFNQDDEPVVYIAGTTTPFSMALGVSIHEDERYPEYWLFAQKGEEAQKTLVPGGEDFTALLPGSSSVASFRGDLDLEGSLYEQQVAFAAAEEQRRRRGRVLVKGSEVRFGHTRMGSVASIVDPRIGFNTKVMSTLLAEIPPGRHSGAHRHVYEEVNFILAGSGYSIIEDRRYDWQAGDALCIPVFSWHQHFNTGGETARFLVHTTRPAMENIGVQATHQGEPADY
jgi:gentisate 1,2-dioxygenase